MATVTDDFNRANGALGANWSDALGYTQQPIITTNEAWAPNSSPSAAYWSANTFDNDQSIDFTYTLSLVASCHPFVRGSSSALTCYSCEQTDEGEEWTSYVLMKWVAGSKSSLAGSNYYGNFGPSNTVRITAVGTSISLYLWEGASWVLRIGPLTDTSIASGSVGIFYENDTPRGDNFSATGAVAGGDPPAAPVVAWHRAHIINQLI